jgi:hypothetical protein
LIDGADAAPVDPARGTHRLTHLEHELTLGIILKVETGVMGDST